ncbi:hypothetical protein RB595_005165 [Gaeumannomyces hyphopodioides]
MRLVNTRSLTLCSFDDDRTIPKFGVLSHTWEKDELRLQDVDFVGGVPPGPLREKSGFRKMQQCCRQALSDGLEWVWIDTCCIDKTSSAELSEAINSMFNWYRRAEVCYAFLGDVPACASGLGRFSQGVAATTAATPFELYRKCRWFTRGWTLQELIAPREVEFYDAGWNPIGSKTTHLSSIERVTRIGRRFLQDVEELNRASVAERMSWAAGRRTTRVEDRAYSLLGIFGINMPLLYGEGARSFARLQEEILRVSDDQSLFAWGLGLPLDDEHGPGSGEGGLFATSPDAFVQGHSINFWGQLAERQPSHHLLTNKGLRIELPLLLEHDEDETAFAVIDCISSNKFLVVPISRAYHDDVFQRTRGCSPRTVSRRVRKLAVNRTIYIQRSLPGSSLTMYFSTVVVSTAALRASGYRLADVYPPHALLEVGGGGGGGGFVRCGDSHRVVLVFRHVVRARRRVALLLTAAYTREKNHLSRPRLDRVECRVAPGPSPGRLVELVLEHGLWSIERGIPFTGRPVDVLGDVVSTRTAQRQENAATWAVEVEVDVRRREETPGAAGEEPRPGRGWARDEDSDSDGFEHIGMAAIAAMLQSSNRDFRQREAWVRGQELRARGRGMRLWRRLMLLGGPVVSVVVVVLAAVLAPDGAGPWLASRCLRHFGARPDLVASLLLGLGSLGLLAVLMQLWKSLRQKRGRFRRGRRAG